MFKIILLVIFLLFVLVTRKNYLFCIRNKTWRRYKVSEYSYSYDDFQEWFCFDGYRVSCWHVLWPFWCGVIGTSASTEKGAKEYIPLLRQKRKEPKEYLYNKGLYIEK